MSAGWTGILTIGAAVLAASAATAAGSGTAPAWQWDEPAATAAPQPLTPPPARSDCDTPPPGVTLPPECAQQVAPDTGSVEGILKPPAVPGPSGSNRAKKASQ